MIDRKIQKILLESKTIAVVGCSSDPKKDSNKVARFLLARGYEVLPVNPFHDRLLGQKTYADLGSIKRPVDIVDVFRPSIECGPLVRESIPLKPRLVWLQKGIKSDEAKNIAAANKLCIIMDKCIKEELEKLGQVKP